MTELQNKIDSLWKECKQSPRIFFGTLYRRQSLFNEIYAVTSYLPSKSNLSERTYHIVNGIKTVKDCKFCGKPTKFLEFSKGYNTYCSLKCVANCEEVKTKCKETTLKNYGVEYSSQSKEVYDKKRQTWQRIHGVDHPFSSKVVKDKRLKTWLTNYGESHISKSIIIKNKKEQSSFTKYGVSNISKADEIKAKKKISYDSTIYDRIFQDRFTGRVTPLFRKEDFIGCDTTYEWQCIKCGNAFRDHLKSARVPRCLNCYPLYCSIHEQQIFEFIESLNINCERTKKIIPPLELDVYLPDYNLAIELDGLHYHSEDAGLKDKFYHLNKTKLCTSKGIQLLHIFEDEWVEKRRVVKSIIKANLGVFDRIIPVGGCTVKEVPEKEAVDFLSENSLQNNIGKFNYGLYEGNTLVYLISLDKSKYGKDYKYEIVENCCKINTQVLGGFDKLISFIISELRTASVIAYTDKRYVNNLDYRTWKYLGDIKPKYYYMWDYRKREPHAKYKKRNLERLFPNSYDKKLTEWQIMKLAGYDRIWDCGAMIFSLE